MKTKKQLEEEKKNQKKIFHQRLDFYRNKWSRLGKDPVDRKKLQAKDLD